MNMRLPCPPPWRKLHSVPPIRVALVEDQRRTREGLAALIGGAAGFEIAGTYGSMEEALHAERFGESHPEWRRLTRLAASFAAFLATRQTQVRADNSFWPLHASLPIVP